MTAIAKLELKSATLELGRRLNRPNAIAAIALAFATSCTPSFLRDACAQTPGSLSVPQTELAPLGGLGTPSAGFGQPQFAPGTGFAPGNGFAPGTGLIAPSLTSPPAGSLFDPYSQGSSSGFVAPQPQGSLFGGLFGNPGRSPGGFAAPSPLGGSAFGAPPSQGPPVFGSANILGGPATVVPQGNFGGPGFASPGTFGAPTGFGFPQSAYPNGAPSSLFPGGLFGPTGSYSPAFNPYRLIQRARFRHAFLFGGNGLDEVEVNDTDVALAFAFPRFLFSNQPLFVAPSFSFHQWDGPNGSTGADLPSNAYSAFLDFGWRSDPNLILGAELNLSVGGFTEFGIFRSESLRVRGRMLGTFRLTPATTFKLGVYYYDRVRIKLLPAGGLLWRPNPFTKVDLIFPQPKISRFVQTVGVYDVWWYVAADYGGGSWTIDRDDGRPDQVDLNDIRVLTGFEWGPSDRMRSGIRTAFFEFGYVGDRELIYRRNPQDDLRLDDTWMVRLGLGY